MVHINVASGAKPSQSEILLEFKNSLRNATALGSWNTSTTPCGGSPGGWVGVICINGDVWGLQLEGMGLMGTIDMDTLAKLPHLRGISFMNNHFDGAIPKIKKLSALKSVFLSNNQFSGEIEDDAFSGMVSLKKVHLAHNKFSGGVPESLALLPRILELRLEGNHFKGQIPEFRATQLQSFNISNNNLEGPIPESLRKMELTSFSGNKNLCGAPLGSCPRPKKPTTLMMVVVGIVVALALSAIIVAFILLRCSKCQTTLVQVETPPLKVICGELDKVKLQESNTESGKKVEQGKLHYLRNDENKCDLKDLLKASAEILGSGYFGSSYKAVLVNGSSVVVKRFRHMNNVGKEEFQEHMRRLGRLKHPNLLPFVAYYYREEEKLLVTDFIDNGSLAIHLHGNHARDQPRLDWATRLKIIKGIAKGLAYLYTELPTLIAPHSHLKSSNVLLSKSFTPLLTDYGLVPLINQEIAQALMVAYKSPEYKQHGRITKKTDVWSFGTLILEILTGKFPTQNLQQGQASDTDLASWVNSVSQEEWEDEVFDKEMGGTTNSKWEMVKLLKIGLACCEGDVGKRWDMKEAVEKIEELKEKDSEDDFYSSYASEMESPSRQLSDEPSFS